jgi:hypothetical protein
VGWGTRAALPRMGVARERVWLSGRWMPRVTVAVSLVPGHRGSWSRAQIVHVYRHAEQFASGAGLLLSVPSVSRPRTSACGHRTWRKPWRSRRAPRGGLLITPGGYFVPRPPTLRRRCPGIDWSARQARGCGPDICSSTLNAAVSGRVSLPARARHRPGSAEAAGNRFRAALAGPQPLACLERQPSQHRHPRDVVHPPRLVYGGQPVLGRTEGRSD